MLINYSVTRPLIRVSYKIKLLDETVVWWVARSLLDARVIRFERQCFARKGILQIGGTLPVSSYFADGMGLGEMGGHIKGHI